MKSQYPVKVPVVGKVYWIVLDREQPWEAQLVVWNGNTDSGTFNRLSDNVLVDINRNDMFFQKYHAQAYLVESKKISLSLTAVTMGDAVEFMQCKTPAKEQPYNLSQYRCEYYFGGPYSLILFTDGTLVIAVSTCDGPYCVDSSCQVNLPVFYLGTPA